MMESMIKRDVNLLEFELVKELKNSETTQVKICRHKPTGKEVVLKLYNKDIVMSTGMLDSVMAERDILRLISGIQVQDLMFSGQKLNTPKLEFPTCLNRLITTTKDSESICLILERAQGIDLVEFIKLL